MPSMELLVDGESGFVMHVGERTSLRTSFKLKPVLFKATNRLPRKARNFRRSYSKANKVSKTEGTRKVEYAYHF